MTTTSTPNSPLPTRQQLDEIDALLKRMLTLPSMTGEAAPPPPTVFPALPPISEATIREIPPPQPPMPEEPTVKSWRVEWPQQQPPSAPSVVAWGSPVTTPAELPPWATSTAPAAPPTPAPAPVSPPPFATPVVTPQPATSVVSNPPLAQPVDRADASFGLAFLKLLNGIFDIVCFILGPLGSWMRGPGRNTLGWIGILMVLTAAVWGFGEWCGYEWPRVDLSRFGISR